MRCRGREQLSTMMDDVPWGVRVATDRRQLESSLQTKIGRSARGGVGFGSMMQEVS